MESNHETNNSDYRRSRNVDSKFPGGLSQSYDEAEASRIERAFKRQDSIPTTKAESFNGHIIHSADFIDGFGPNSGDLKSSVSMHGISNPNYGGSSTTSSSDHTSVENLPFQMNVTPPHENQKHADDVGSNVYNRRAHGIKKASLFVWMTLQSVPEETIISPHILEFLEQTLEPIPPKTNFNTTGTLECSIIVYNHFN